MAIAADEVEDEEGGGALDGGEGAQGSSSGSSEGMGVWSLVSSSNEGVLVEASEETEE
jgi:hypothetical protein